MKTLIYLASLGSPVYRRMTELCIHSLREVGGYSGPILVFTNNGYMPQGAGIEAIRIPPGLDLARMQGFKAAAAPAVPAEKYDRILWLDCDMLAVDAVSPLFSGSGEHVRGMVEAPWTRMSDDACGDCLTPAERRRAGTRWGINTGLLCVPSRSYREYMRLWSEEIEIRRDRLTHWPDQTPFNALVLNRRIPFRAYPRGWIEMPPMYFWKGGRLRVTAATRILHFCWAQKRHVVEEMRVFLDALGAGEPARRRRRPLLQRRTRTETRRVSRPASHQVGRASSK